jgi:phthalate 4,5-cis-dihydrodiol dehydrogenase
VNATPATIGLGIVGLGRATALMLLAFQASPHAAVVAGADPRPAAREAFRSTFGGTPYASAEELCADRAVDAVVIATPPELHARQVAVAAAAGKHVLVEKPMAPTLAECDRMIAAAAEAGVHLLVGHTLAYSPAIRAIAHAVAAGQFGRLGSILSLYYTDYVYRPRRPADLVPGTGQGIVLNQLPHVVDCIRLIAGGVVESVAAAALWEWDPDRPVPGAGSAFLRLPAGAAAQVVYSGYDRFDSVVWTFGVDELGYRVAHEPGASRRRLREVAASGGSEGDVLESKRFGGGAGGAGDPADRQPQPGVLLVSCEHADLRPSEDGVAVFAAGGVEHRRIAQPHWPAGRTDVLRALYDAVVHDRACVHDGAWGKATVEVCLAIESAARGGGEVVLRAQRPPATPVTPPTFVDETGSEVSA